MRVRIAVSSTLLLLTGCAHGGSWNAAVASSAQRYLEERPPLEREDCSGFVCSVLRDAGHSTARGNTRMMWEAAVRDRRVVSWPRPGDLVFFDDTYDRNHNGRLDDRLTHIGMVLRTESETIIVIHRASRGITTMRLTPSRPRVHRRGGIILNDYLRKRGYGPKKGRRLSGQLLHGFARPPRPDSG